MLFWTPEQQVAGYRNIAKLYDTRAIHAGGRPYPLEPAPRDFSDVVYQIDGVTYTLDQHLRDQRVAGLLVVEDGRILLERYSLGNDERSRWISFSIAKSVVSILIGAAIADGYIGSVDEPITRYLPALAGGGYDGVSIRNVLQMASGVAWNEDYADPESDVARTPRGNLALLRYMSARPRELLPGEKFNYNTGETHLAGALLRSAIGNNLSTYLTHQIWRPFGMESDAEWMLHEPGGGETGGCCIMATLRDYARIGLFAMNGGVLPDGTRVLPDGWMAESTAPSKGSAGYGYLWWLRDGGAYAGIGIFGQLLWIDPQSKLVIVTHSAWPKATDRELSRHRWALVEALAAAARRG
jgi:CubicO group peptidase (beta-lactamase class C family)